ncbi:Galactosyltransferase family protein [Aphelenchoides avenae]|nr:Galactosyltransferase family protein [Aphelenchus avenae]
MGGLESACPRREYDLRTEQDAYNDLLVGNFTDSYHNISHKFLLAINYAMDYCDMSNALPFVFLVDDDHFVVVRNLVEELGRHAPTEKVYMGHLQKRPVPMRSVFHKNYVSLAEYPYDRYPPFISAGAVLLSQETVRLFHEAVPTTKLYKWDDVYAGILAHRLRIEPQGNTNFRFVASKAGASALVTGIAAHGYQFGM